MNDPHAGREPDSIDRAVGDYEARQEVQPAPPAAKPRSRIPLLVACLALFALSAASAVYRLRQPPAGPPSRDELLGGAIYALERGAESVDALRAQLGELPPQRQPPELEALAGLDYERLGPNGYALSVPLGGDTIRLEVQGGTRRLSGPGTERFPTPSQEGR